MRRCRSGTGLAAVVLMASVWVGGMAQAAEFAKQLTRIVVPFAPGGGTDIIGRTLAQELAKSIGGTVIVENRPGAGTVLGTDFVAKSPPDGHTLLMATFSHAVNPSLRRTLPFDTEKDFVPVALIARSYNVVVTNPKSGIGSIADLISQAKAQPDRFNYGTFGPGTSGHLAGELFKSLAGVKLTAVHYKGSAPAITDLLGGTIQIMFSTVPSVSSLMQSGQLKALAVTSVARSPAFPDLPTVAEAGVPGYAAESWYGVFAPAGSAPDAVQLLNAAIDKAIKAPSFNKLVENEGLVMIGGAPEQLGDYVKGEQARWRKVIQDAGIEPE